MSAAIIRLCGDSAVSVEFENEISMETNKKVKALKYRMEEQPVEGILELVPSYRALLIHYDPLRIRIHSLTEQIEACLIDLPVNQLPIAWVTEIPVLYEGEDIEEIAKLEHKTIEEIIGIHSQSDYFVYMLGFAPGHPYTARFENPFSFKRRETPRVKIPGGSIVVQLDLSDIIPFEQPCGWNVIGSTPVRLCDCRKDNPFLLRAGQWIRHIPIDRLQFAEIEQQVKMGTYVCRTYKKEISPRRLYSVEKRGTEDGNDHR